MLSTAWFFPVFAPLTTDNGSRTVGYGASASHSTIEVKHMSKKTSGTKSKPMSQDAKARIYSATARNNDGAIPPDSFAARAASAADKASTK